MPVPHHSSFLQAGCPSCRPTNSVKALKAQHLQSNLILIVFTDRVSGLGTAVGRVRLFPLQIVNQLSEQTFDPDFYMRVDRDHSSSETDSQCHMSGSTLGSGATALYSSARPSHIRHCARQLALQT